MADAVYAEDDPRYHTARVRQMLEDVMSYMRTDAQRVDDPRAQALFETSAEVLNGLITAFTHYGEGREAARPPGGSDALRAP